MPPEEERLTLISTLADWADTIPAISSVILFGSRARGDHRADSDVDLRIEFDYGGSQEDFQGWLLADARGFADLKIRLPGPLSLHQDDDDVVILLIQEARAQPLLSMRKVICVATPPKR